MTLALAETPWSRWDGVSADFKAGISSINMFSMRTLLAFDPFLPHDVREAVIGAHDDARDQLVRLGVNDCEAGELLDDLRDDAGDAPQAVPSIVCFCF